MSNLVIVAIPAEDDPVWQISSEKVPHMTILFLGNQAQNVNKIKAFTEHAAKIMLKRFGLDVDRRGELGEDKADVLFFEDRWGLEDVKRFRGQLLKDNNIRTAYDSAPQFEGPWQPHLTLGYPDAPAKKLPDPHSNKIYWVQFDRIAVWDGDYEGEEYQLESYDYGISDVAMTSLTGIDFLQHFGVKGMKWGVRKDRSSTPREVQVKTKHTVTGKAKIKTKSGSHQEITEDALKMHVARQKLRRSGPDALTNQELREVATRLQLEAQVAALGGKSRSRSRTLGAKAVDELLADPVSTAKTTASTVKKGKKAAVAVGLLA